MRHTRFTLSLSDFVVGLPAGMLIFISTLLFTTLLGRLLSGVNFEGRQWLALPVLAFDAFIVGLLSRLMRPYHGVSTALAASIIAMIIFLGLRFRAETYNPVIFGLPGLAAIPAFCLLGAWQMGRWRERKSA